MLNWTKHGFEVCGEASDGISAKQLIEQYEPEIVITDIKMPGLDGLALINFLYENYPRIQIIALSGYDDYDYVRTSLKLGVVDYLLKHSLNKESLLAVLASAQKRIRSEQESQLHNRHLQEQLAYGQDVIQQRFLLDLLEGRYKETEEIRSKALELSLPIALANMLVVVAEIDGMSNWKIKVSQREWRVLFDKTMEMLSKILPKDECVLIPLPDNRFVILFAMRGVHSALLYYKMVGDCIQQVRASLKRHYNVTACYSLSRQLDLPDELPQAYQKACGVLEDNIYRDFDIIIYDYTVPKTVVQDYYIGFHDEQTILQMLKSADSEGLNDYLAFVFCNIRESVLDRTRVRMIFAQLINLLNRVLRDYGKDLVAVYPDFHRIYQSLQQMTLQEMNQFIQDCYQNTLQFIEQFGNPHRCHEATRKACAYISRNYTGDLSLGDIAQNIGVSPSYLSRIFKEDTGRGVVEYLNSIRVEHAKRLIQEGVRLNELSGPSGFNSDSYFFTVFKQITGKTPRQYKAYVQGTPQ